MGIIDVSNVPSAGYAGVQAAVNAGSKPHVGMVAGEVAFLADGELSLEDSAEEISLHMADRTEAKHHSERKVRGEKPPTVVATEAILAYMADVHDEDAQAKLTQLAHLLIEGKQDPRRIVSEKFQDIPRQYLALQYAMRKGEEGAASEKVLADISDALAELELESGAEITAARNTIAAAGAFAASTDGVVAFQHTYRDVVLGESTLGETLSLALKQFGARDCGQGLRSLIQALGLDLAATNPSTSPTRLQTLVTDMRFLGVALTALEGCHELCARLDKTLTVHKSYQEGSDPTSRETKLMRDVVDISAGQWVTKSRFDGLASEFGAQAIEARIYFLGGVRAILKDLPVEMYVDDKLREAVLSAAQDALDAAVGEEGA
jgi:type III secretion protein W